MTTKPLPASVAIGVVGGHEFIERVVRAARSQSHGVQLVLSAYEAEGEAATAVERISENVDALLFAGPLPFHHAKAAGMGTPASFVPTGGSALYAGLTRCLLQGLDPCRVSVDSVDDAELDEATRELGLGERQVAAMPYEPGLRPEHFLDHHREAFRSGRAVGALTTVPSVAHALAEEGIPHELMRPSEAALMHSLRTAVLLGTGARMDDSRLAVIIAQIDEVSSRRRSPGGAYWAQDVRLQLHRALLQEARALDALVSPRDDGSFLVLLTAGSLRAATDELSSPPFPGLAHATDFDTRIGIGLGDTALNALTNAEASLALGANDPAAPVQVCGLGPAPLPLSGEYVEVPRAGRARESRIRDELVDALAAGGHPDLVVDAESVARLSQVSLRTARRTLRGLVDAGLAWQLPPAQSSTVGRPAARFQLIRD